MLRSDMELSDHIKVFDDALSPARCQALIDRF